MKKEINVWFKRKTYGYGWVPATREGWLVIFIYTLFIILFFSNLKDFESNIDVFLKVVIPTLLSTVILLLICYKKGESPRWQWGEGKRN